jgi:hypothetical protein
VPKKCEIFISEFLKLKSLFGCASHKIEEKNVFLLCGLALGFFCKSPVHVQYMGSNIF